MSDQADNEELFIMALLHNDSVRLANESKRLANQSARIALDTQKEAKRHRDAMTRQRDEMTMIERRHETIMMAFAQREYTPVAPAVAAQGPPA